MSTKIHVFIVDDSAVVRGLLSEKLSGFQDIEVVGSAMDPFVARERIVKVEVDVLILDIEMPRMDGLTFLKYLMKYKPIPTIILSSLAGRDEHVTLDALSLGAVRVLSKPGGPYSVTELIDDLVETIRSATRIDMRKLYTPSKRVVQRPEKKRLLASIKTSKHLVAFGASTGGTQAYERVFPELPEDFPATLAVIHMPEGFTASFARRLDQMCAMTVVEAKDAEKALRGHIYIAPGNRHLSIVSTGADYILRLGSGPKVCNQRPSVDVLFFSVADFVGKNSTGILLTGMGRDGAAGLKRMRDAGAHTIGQDEQSCIVYGMPREAFELGAVETQLPLDRVAAELIRQVGRL